MIARYFSFDIPANKEAADEFENLVLAIRDRDCGKADQGLLSELGFDRYIANAAAFHEEALSGLQKEKGALAESESRLNEDIKNPDFAFDAISDRLMLRLRDLKNQICRHQLWLENVKPKIAKFSRNDWFDDWLEMDDKEMWIDGIRIERYANGGANVYNESTDASDVMEECNVKFLASALSKVMKRHGMARPIAFSETGNFEARDHPEYYTTIFIVGPDKVKSMPIIDMMADMSEEMRAQTAAKISGNPKSGTKSGPKM